MCGEINRGQRRKFLECGDLASLGRAVASAASYSGAITRRNEDKSADRSAHSKVIAGIPDCCA